MGERQLSSAAIAELARDDEKTVRYFRACIRRSSMHGVNERRDGDRRVAINSFCDPRMERRSGYDRRR